MSETTAMDHTPVESYATRGLRLWAGSRAPHGPGHLCLSCADTRKYLDEPMVPAPMAVPLREDRAAS